MRRRAGDRAQPRAVPCPLKTNSRRAAAAYSSRRICILLCMRTLLAALIACGILSFNACISCSTKQNPDQLKENTAAATAALKSDAKALAGGVVEGLRRPTPEKPLDLNTASQASLKTLPGIAQADAERIVAARPYERPSQLLERHIVSREQYDRIADLVTVPK